MTTNPDSHANQVRVACANTLSAETLAQVTGSRSARVTVVGTDGTETVDTFPRPLVCAECGGPLTMVGGKRPVAVHVGPGVVALHVAKAL